jgi:large subunit ribosomal protein L24
MHGRWALAGADVAALLPGEGRAALAGKLTAQVEVDASGRSPATLVGSLAGTGTLSLAGAEIAGFDPDAFNTVIRAIDEETTIDAAKVRDIMAAALDRNNLRVDRADAAFTIAAGDVRLSTAILHGEGADLNATGHFNLADRQLDARLTFSASVPAGSSGGRPEVYVTVRGPLGATQRAIDATTLSAWLTLRAVDREARRIDALEAARAPPLVPTEPPPAPTGTVAAPLPSAPTPPAPRPVAPPPRRAAPASRPEASAAPGPAAPALPPPVNIRPPASATGAPPRPKAPGPAGTKTAPARAPVEAPTEERSLLERLFGSQR